MLHTHKPVVVAIVVVAVVVVAAVVVAVVVSAKTKQINKTINTTQSFLYKILTHCSCCSFLINSLFLS